MCKNKCHKTIITCGLVILMILTCIGCGPSLASVKEWEVEGEIDSLIAVLQNNDERIRIEAKAALLRTGDPAVIPLVIALEDDASRGEATKVLMKMNRSWVIDPLVTVLKEEGVSPPVLIAIAKILRKHGSSRSVEALVSNLEHKDIRVKKKMIWALERIGDSRAVKPLEKIAKEDPDLELREAAQKALSQIKGR